MVALHSPSPTLVASKYVQFSELAPPQPTEKTQHTPKPEAQVPDLTPPLLEQSDL